MPKGTVAATDELVAAVPHNPNTPGEFGRENAVAPPTGFSIEPATPDVGASTLSESNASNKTGSGDAITGANPFEPLLFGVSARGPLVYALVRARRSAATAAMYRRMPMPT